MQQHWTWLYVASGSAEGSYNRGALWHVNVVNDVFLRALLWNFTLILKIQHRGFSIFTAEMRQVGKHAESLHLRPSID